MPTPKPSATPQRAASLMAYPSLFPIKIMGTNSDALAPAITLIAQRFDPTFDASRTELRSSKGGNYLGITIYVTATSQAQLDALYRALGSHPGVKVVL